MIGLDYQNAIGQIERPRVGRDLRPHDSIPLGEYRSLGQTLMQTTLAQHTFKDAGHRLRTLFFRRHIIAVFGLVRLTWFR